MDNGAKNAAGLATEFGKGGFHLCEKYILFRVGQSLPAHAGDDVGHGEPEEDEVEEGAHGGENGDDPNERTTSNLNRIHKGFLDAFEHHDAEEQED